MIRVLAYMAYVSSTLSSATWETSLNAQTSPWSVAEELYDLRPVPRERRLLISCGRQPALWAKVIGVVKVRRQMVGCVLMDADRDTGRDKAAVDDTAAFRNKTTQTRWRW